MIHLEKVSEDNVVAIIKLSDTLDAEQKKAVAPNAVSLAQAYPLPDRAWPRAIYNDDELVGFVMMSLHDDDIPTSDQPAYYLWRFMIAGPHQGKGYGKQVLDLLVKKCREDGMKYLYVSCTMTSLMPYRFYVKYGFVDTHEMDDDEEILKIAMATERNAVISGN
jgi:diamine N-acetyltransferase